MLAAYGAALQHSTITAWWERWRRRAASGDGIAEELRLAAAGVRAHVPSPARHAWLHAMGRPGGDLAPEEAQQWRDAWAQQGRVMRRCRLPWRVVGEGVHRSRVGRAVATGRRILGRLPGRGRGALRVVRADGTLLARPGEVEEELWASRRPIWATRPPGSAARRPLLDA